MHSAARSLALALGSLLILGLCASSARALTFTVCASGCDFSSIQTAHNSVGAGDTLDIQGTITEPGIVLSKNIDLTSSLPTPPVVQAASAPFTAGDRVFFVSAGIQVSLENLIVRHGVFAAGGGGILNFGQLTITRVRVERNQSNFGGGIFSQGAGALLDVSESSFDANEASIDGGGIYCDGGSVSVERSTFSKNRSFEGGAIMNRVSCSLTVNNSTFSMNVGINGGGGIFNEDGGSVTVNSATFALNSLRGIQNNGATSSFALRNSLLGNSLDSSGLPGSQDCEVFLGGGITDNGHNIVETPGGCSFGAATSSTGVDPGLSALADYGGPTRTHALLGTSAALGSGDAGSLSVDQRGESRPQGGIDDVGAFEFRDSGEFVRPPAFCAPVVGNGQVHFVEFADFSNRSPNFHVQIQQSNGSFASHTPNFFHHATFLGTPDGVPGAVAGALYFPLTGEHYYQVIFEDGTQWSNEGGPTTVRTGSLAAGWPQLVPEVGGAGGGIWAAEVGVDLPYDRFAFTHGSEADDALAMIEHSIMSANLTYLQQAGIQHRLGRVILRGAAAPDPYAPLSTHNQYLSELVNQWDNVLPASSHDLALVVHVTSAAGLGFVGRIGSPAGYTSNDATARGDFSRPWRHEAGHNWFLGHFDGGTPEGPTINSGNDLGRMSAPEQALITDFRDTRTAFLDDLGALPAALPPRAATDRQLLSNKVSSSLIDVLANDHDANGDALTLVSIDSVSSLGLGGTMALAPGQGGSGQDVVRYTAPSLAGPTSAFDRFRYRIRDATGRESVGYVFLRIVDFDPVSHYQQDFDAFADGSADFDDGSYISDVTEASAASVQGQALELTADALSRLSSFTLPPQNLQGGYNASFRYRITSAATPADGFAFNFGAPNATRIPVDGIGEFPRGLSVEWNTFAAPGYHVRVDGTQVPGGFVPDGSLVDGIWHSAAVSWDPVTGLDLWVGGNAVFQQLATPGFVPTPDDMLAFSALTIGLSEEVRIDDVAVMLPEPSGPAGLFAGVGALYGLLRRRRASA